MTLAFQQSLLDDGAGPDGPASPVAWLRPLGQVMERRPLSHGAWVDVRRGWVAGADELFGRLLAAVPWQAERRPMYDRVVAVPRLLRFYPESEPLPDPLLDQARLALSRWYAAELGESFATTGMCLYRDGRDSVAWHGDRIGRGATQDTMVAILSLGTPRTLRLRPRPAISPAAGVPGSARSASARPQGGSSRGGSPQGGSGVGPAGPEAGREVAHSLRFDLGHGDLLVMGGSCQRTWEHAILKTARGAGPRISVQFRPHGVR